MDVVVGAGTGLVVGFVYAQPSPKRTVATDRIRERDICLFPRDCLEVGEAERMPIWKVQAQDWGLQTEHVMSDERVRG